MTHWLSPSRQKEPLLIVTIETLLRMTGKTSFDFIRLLRSCIQLKLVRQISVLQPKVLFGFVIFPQGLYEGEGRPYCPVVAAWPGEL